MLKQADLSYFGSIRIDLLHLFIRNQKYLRNDRLGVYNQVKEILSRVKGKAELFDEYLKEWAKVDKLSSSVVAKWEDSLYRDTKPNFYAAMFRVLKISANHFEIYARLDGGNTLEKLCSSKDGNIYKIIKNYCEFWTYANTWCLSNDVINPADIPIGNVKSDFRSSLMANLIPEVKDIKVLSNNSSEYCLSYYDLTQGSLAASTPAWDNFLRQMINDECRDTYRAWVYSLYCGDNYGRQVIWLHGPGESGKTAQANVLFDDIKSLNPEIVTSLETIDNTDKFSLSTYRLKRFALAADSTDRALVRHNLVKNLTGDDTVAIREMGKTKDYARVHCKIMVTSNKTPFVNIDSPEELSRLILISLVPNQCVDAKHHWYKNYAGMDWKSALKKELPDFIRQCEAPYLERLNPDGQNFKQYDGHIKVLETAKYFVARDLPVWWNACIISTGDKSDVIKLSELSRDYERFLRGEMWVDNTMRWIIKSSTLKFLRERQVEIVEMQNFNTIFLVGYRFIIQEPKERPTANKVILDMLMKELDDAG